MSDTQAPTISADLELRITGKGNNNPEDCRLDMYFSRSDSSEYDNLLATADITIPYNELRQDTLDPAAYGARLTNTLFADPMVLGKYYYATGVASGAGALRVRLSIDERLPQLHQLRWEKLLTPDNPTADPTQRSTFATSRQTPFSRYLSGRDWIEPRLLPRPDMRALVVVANPSNIERYNMATIDVDAEAARIRYSMGDTIAITPIPSGGYASLTRINNSLIEKHYPILYLVAHGGMIEGTPYLWLEKPDGTADVVEAGRLVTILRDLGDKRPQLIVLASCQSASSGDHPTVNATNPDPNSDLDKDNPLLALGPQLAQAGIPAVLAMQGKITIHTVESFMPTFFRQLQQDGQIDRAVAEARGVVRTHGDWWMPVLFMRVREGRMWQEDSGKGNGGDPPMTRPTAQATAFSINQDKISERKLREKMTAVFQIQDLDTLCHNVQDMLRDADIDLPVDMERVGNRGGREHQILNLIGYLRQRGYLNYLIQAVLEMRPDSLTIDDIRRGR